MKVYVVTWNQSYDGAIYQGVFASEEAAQEWINQDSPHPLDRKWYEIIEEDVG